MIYRLWVVLLLFIATSCSSTKVDHAYRQNRDRPTQVARKEGAPQVVIDPGHGGFEGGARYFGVDEKDLCLRTGMLLRHHLEKRGYNVIMTRTRDEHVPVKRRAEIANTSKSQVLVSVHFNAAKSKMAQGIEIFYASKTESWRAKKSKQLAATILSKLVANTGCESRGVKEGNWCVIRETQMPSIIVEGGFMSNEEELRKITDERYLDKLASGIADGLDDYFKRLAT